MAYSTFGSFILFKEMADDDLGRLYRAGEVKGQALGRTVWLRVLDGRGVPRSDVAARLPTARRIGEVLHSANVTGKPTYLEHEGVPALAWDYVSGQPLSRVFQAVRHEGFPVPVDNALLIIEKIALGLAAGLTVEVDGTSLVHGFLHPGMVVVTNDGEAVVAGFGLGEELLGMLEDGAAAAAVSPYLAPEVLVSRTTSKRGDVYSLGAILFQLLAGEPLPADPAARPEALEAATLSFDESPLPADILVVLRRALAARSEERFSSAADFKKELDKLLYGGAYSPTTFNLALFMDRLFRPEIEAEERERLSEAEVDPVPLMAAPEPEPMVEPTSAPARGGGRGLLFGGLAAVLLVSGLIAGFLLMGRGPEPAALPPTPTPEEVAAERASQQKAVEALVQEQVAALMAEREDQIRSELSTRQDEIEDLQRRLRDMQTRPAAGGADQTRREQEALQRRLAAAEAAQEEQEAALQAERERKLEEVRQKLAAATPTAAPTVSTVAAQVPQDGPTGAAPLPTSAPATSVPAPAGGGAAPAQAPTKMVVTENMWIEPTQVDSPPAVLKEADVVWPKVAYRSRVRGLVIMRATVNADGRVEEVEILRADDDGFGIPQAARDAVFKYLFRPATKNGVKVKTTVTVTQRYAFAGR